MKFSVIVVCLNPGEKLNRTLDSILSQSWKALEIIVKDGGSTDGSIEGMRADGRIRLYREKDRGIYDAMNQAVSHGEGDFILFLNCGDTLADGEVLERAAKRIAAHPQPEKLVIYGDTYGEKNGVHIAASPRITGFTCFRNIPCHQSCIYAAGLCRAKPYNEEYRIRADYDHFLWCYYEGGADMVYLESTIASYEGGGYSESRENREQDKAEHRKITESYMKPAELAKYRLLMGVSLAPLRSFLAENPFFSSFYHWIKDAFYR